MKLVRYRSKKKEDYGLMRGGKIVCLPTLSERLGVKFPQTLKEFVSFYTRRVEETQELLDGASEKDIQLSSYSLDKVAILAPITYPPKIICLGLNYRDHAAEQGAHIPDEPIIFMKPRTTIIGSDENIVKPSFVKQLDYEAELAIVMGKKAKNISAEDAKSCIFGYTIVNDVSARDIQFKDKQWTRGKSFDTFAPTGPCITTEDQLKDTSNLSICTWVNDELRQNSSTKNMVFNVSEIVYHLSRVMTLEPCDIIATGTPAGVGFAVKPKPSFLKAGDVVRIEIEKIGILRNNVIEESWL